MREKKNDLELEADRLLREDTRKRGSGLTSRPPAPANEMLFDDPDLLAGQGAHFDEYPSLQGPVMDENLRQRYLNQLLDSLTKRQAEVVTLCIFGRLSNKAAGEILGLASGTVNAYLESALKKMRKKINNDHIACILFPETFQDDEGGSEGEPV